jgi:ribosomal protein S12 methylthiotransferase accessory factor YcaO
VSYSTSAAVSIENTTAKTRGALPCHTRAIAQIGSARKLNSANSERVVAARETLLDAARIAAAKGVTRVADITGLDRLGIPVHCAVVPRSDDGLSVYNGKGLTAIDSRTGALMEAIERQTALYAQVPLIESSYRWLSRGNLAVVDPQSFNHKLTHDYSEDRVYSWTEGFDLLNEEPVLVPAGLACYGPQFASVRSPYDVNSSNGLASGNCFLEAVCHAMCELLERDAWTLADLRSQWIPLARRQAIFGPALAAHGWDDPTPHPRIDLSGAGDAVTGLMQNFQHAGLRPVVRDITSDFGIPSVMAVVADDSVPGFPQAHGGMGAHPNARIAVLRALTELAQSRAVDIQGVREDLKPAGIQVHPADRKLQRVQKVQPQRWMLQQAGVERSFDELASVDNEDIADDIRLTISRLAQNGIERVIVVDFSEPHAVFSVVRVLIPGLEFWALDHGKLGSRAVQFWRQHA